MKQNRSCKMLWLVLVFVAALAGSSRADSLTTTFAATEIAAGNWTNLFNLTVSNAGSLQITSFTINAAQSGGPFTLQVYIRPLTYVGSENTTLGWTLISSGTLASGGPNGPVEIDTSDFLLAPGTYGIALINTNYQIGYTTGAMDFSNANLAIDNGATTQGPLAGTVLADRTWNGTITYNVVPEPSTTALLALGGLAALLRIRRTRR